MRLLLRMKEQTGLQDCHKTGYILCASYFLTVGWKINIQP